MEMTQEHLENLKGLRCDRPRQDGQHWPRIPGTNHSHLVANPSRCWDFCFLFLKFLKGSESYKWQKSLVFREVFSLALKKKIKTKDKKIKKEKDNSRCQVPAGGIQHPETLPKNQFTKAAVTGDRTGPGAEGKPDALWKESNIR